MDICYIYMQNNAMEKNKNSDVNLLTLSNAYTGTIHNILIIGFCNSGWVKYIRWCNRVQSETGIVIITNIPAMNQATVCGTAWNMSIVW